MSFCRPQNTKIQKVPISAIIFGGRRSSLVPVVYRHLTGTSVYMLLQLWDLKQLQLQQAVGNVRQDPFAMLPFMGYHAADYFTLVKLWT